MEDVKQDRQNSPWGSGGREELGAGGARRRLKSQPGRWPTVELTEGGSKVGDLADDSRGVTDGDEVDGSGAKGAERG